MIFLFSGVNHISDDFKHSSEQFTCLPDKSRSSQADIKHHNQQKAVDLTYTNQLLPDVGVQFDVTVTQVDRPDLVYIQRFPPSFDGDLMLVDDSADTTAQNAYKELVLLEELSFDINNAECFGHEEKVLLDQVKKGK